MNTRHLAAIALLLTPLMVACDASSPSKHPSDSKPRKAVTEAEDPTSETTYADPEADDFYFLLKTTQQQCFGSAGCNVTVKPLVTYIGLDDLDPGKTYELTYTITGDESGPIIDTMTLEGDGTLTYHTSSLSTTSSATDVEGKITAVEETG